MKMTHKSRRGSVNPIALLTAGAILVPTVLAGCGGGAQQTTTSQLPPGVGSNRPAASQGGMSGKQKMMVLAGAAALYYIYNKRKNANAAQGQVQYYQSKTSGRIYYYKNPSDKSSVTFVSPPTRPIQVPAEEAQQFQGYQGYNNQASGQKFGGYSYNPSGQYDQNPGAVPAEMF